ncbi:MAG TPA: peptidoglycan-binding protein [Candidatus Faecivicinus avistercoris]|nr:peptidoglycan-binding protein [Candidatus Faecivicinus avistercoris]
MGLGTFVKYTDADHCRSSKYLKRGDILCTRTKGHVVVVLNDGELAGSDDTDYELGDRILRDGDYGADVIELQTRLKAVGYDPGEIDGEFGPNTEDAVEALQTAAGITVDGEFGPDSLAALVKMEGMDDPDEPADDPEDEPAGPSVEISGGNAYIRIGPGTQYDAMGVAHAGDKLAFANPDSWVPVLVDDRIGWISGKYATIAG